MDAVALAQPELRRGMIDQRRVGAHHRFHDPNLVGRRVRHRSILSAAEPQLGARDEVLERRRLAPED
jgi:hypothetical protein